MDGIATVHIIEDDDAVRHAVGLLLELNGFFVRPYASGAEFLRDVRPGANSCLVTDMNMPGLNGVDVIEHLRQEGNGVPAIVMTGHQTPTTEQAAVRAGALVLEKPFRPGELVAAIHDALSRYQP